MTHQMNPLGLSGDFIGGRLKMKRKRIVGVVLALAVVFSCFTVPAFAQENLREEPLTFVAGNDIIIVGNIKVLK